MKRIPLALLAAILGVSLSWIFLRPMEWTTSTDKNKVSIGKVLHLRNDVNRQESGRLLWSPIRTGDEIYLGDKIKTAGLSSAIIQFNHTSSKLEIEENSMIVMAQGGDKLALNMLEGRVFLKQTEGRREQGLDLMSGGKKLEVSGNTAVSINGNGQSQIESFSDNIFTDIRPSYSEEILSLKNEIIVKWRPSDRTELVEVLTGESPLLLKKIEGRAVTFKEGKLEVPLRSGTSYWQLIANGQKSPLMKVTLNRPIPPVPSYPADREVIKAGDRSLDFKWIKGNVSDNVTLEVAKDQEFIRPVFSQEINNQTYFTPSNILPEGQYFWRVKSKLPKGEWIQSAPLSFTVHHGTSLLSPAPILPSDNSIVYLPRSGMKEVNFEWRKQQGVQGYHLKVSGDQFLQERDIKQNTVSLNMMKTGRYAWEVVSFTNDGKRSIFPVKRNFEVRETEFIPWAMTQKTFLYLDQLPVVILKWDKKYPGISLLHISSSQDMKDSESFQVQGRDFPFRVLRPGYYFSKVTSVDGTGQVAAESDIFDFHVLEAPLPPAPEILNARLNKLKATPQGDLRTKVANAKANWLVIASITDGNGRTIDERRFSDDTVSFTGLMPGKFILQMKFEDEYKRISALSGRYELDVPEKSQVAAPKIKGVIVR